jgi:PEP-CTERM motif-containing protein
MKCRVCLSLIFVAVTLAWVGSASALSISFLEPISPTGNIDVSVMNLSVPFVVSTSPESASLTVGTVTTSSTLLARVALTQPGSMHMEGGGQGVSDLLELRTFSAPTGAPAGFQVSFQSDGETGIPNPGGLTAVLVETGLEQLLLSGTFSLPVVGSVDLTVTGRSDLDPVPEPATLLLFGTTMTGLGLVARWKRRRQE